MESDHSTQVTTLRDYLRILRRRKWIVVQAAVLAPLAAFAVSLTQERMYEASSQVLLTRQNLASTLNNVQDPTVYLQAERVAATQADLARVPEVAARAIDAAGVDGTAEDLLESSAVSTERDSDLLKFSVTLPNEAHAMTLATEYGRAYTEYRRELDTARITSARKEVTADLAQLRASGDQKSPLYASLIDKEQQLRTMEALVTEPVLVRPATKAEQVQPRPIRNALIGLALGLFLGIGLAFLWEALDTRIRSADEIGESLDLPLLARLPHPPKELATKNELVMLADPTSVHAEAVRMLRTNLEFVSLERDARVIMVTSAVEGEGKSTTAANLAIALARAGRKVALVDLDLRRPYVDRFFDVELSPGLTRVALGRATLADALVAVPITGVSGNGRGPWSAPGNGNGSGRLHGVLEVLTTGPIPPDPGEFVGTQAVANIIQELRARAELVIIDAPPLLHVGDATALSTKVDGLIVVARLSLLRRPTLKELERVLAASPAPALGFVATAAETEDDYGSSGYYGYKAYGRSEQREAEPVA